MPGQLMTSVLKTCSLCIQTLLYRVGIFHRDRRGTVAISFAVAALPIALGIAAAVDFAGMAAGRAALQRAADNAALSGAAAYVAYTTGDALNAVAISTALSAFCNATTALPGGFTVTPNSNSCTGIGAVSGAAVSAKIAGYQTGTPGIASNSGCSINQTVVPNYTCGFVVTVTATANTSATFASLLGASHTLAVTATAINPFVNLGTALSAKLNANAGNANSIWIYPLVLDADGQPDFSVSSGALPDTSSCTGAPDVGWCGNYSMIASNKYSHCTATKACPALSDGTTFGSVGGIVTNIHASSAVITATTPLGVAFQSAAGANQPKNNYNSYGYQNSQQSIQNNSCTFPFVLAYNTIPQMFDAQNKPMYTTSKKDSQGRDIRDANGNVVQYWVYPTHWFYSSYLANNLPPSQANLDVQGIEQSIQSIPQVVGGVSIPFSCIDPITKKQNPSPKQLNTSYPTSMNCSLYVDKDPTNVKNPSPDATYSGSCYSPSQTRGREYAALSCQNYGKSNYVFYWNDMGSGPTNKPNDADDKDYDDGVLVINCSAVGKIILIN